MGCNRAIFRYKQRLPNVYVHVFKKDVLCSNICIICSKISCPDLSFNNGRYVDALRKMQYRFKGMGC